MRCTQLVVAVCVSLLSYHSRPPHTADRCRRGPRDLIAGIYVYQSAVTANYHPRLVVSGCATLLLCMRTYGAVI